MQSAIVQPRPDSARAHLRAATRDAHDAAEATAVMQALLADTLDLAGYASLLHALHRHFSAWESHNARTLAAVDAAGWRYASRADALADDLATLDASPPLRAAATHAQEPDLPQAWGMLYVIEGSTLGGRLVSARLRARFPGLDALRYFSLGEDDPARWRRFERVLERALPDAATRAAAVRGAHRAFADVTHAMMEATA